MPKAAAPSDTMDLDPNSVFNDREPITKAELDADIESFSAGSKPAPTAKPAGDAAPPPPAGDAAPPPVGGSSDALGGGKSVDTGIAADNLDKLLEEAQKAEAEEAAKKAAAKPADAAPAAPPADAAPAAAPAAPPADAPPAPPASDTPAKDVYDDIVLPKYAKPETGEQFGKLKALAREREKQLSEKLTVAEAKASKLEEDIKGRLTKEESTEFEDLRKWRNTLEVERDPSFKQYDEDMDRHEKAVYELLKAAGMNEEHLAKVKEVGGPAKLDWGPLVPSLPAGIWRSIEARLLQREIARDQKQIAIDKAKANADQFLAERNRKHEDASKEAERVENETLNSLTKDAEWLKEAQIAKEASEEEKAVATRWNKFIKEQHQRIKALAADHSPRTRAELVIGTTMAYHFKAEADILRAELTKASKALEDSKAELDRIKKAGGAGRRSGNPSPHQVPRRTQRDFANLQPGDALDALRAEIETARE